MFATALLTAFVSSAVFGLSLALGAFVAGLLVSESEMSHQAAAEILPFRDLFAVLFFVSVGMLLDPSALATTAPAAPRAPHRRGGRQGRDDSRPRAVLGMPMRSAILLGATVAQVGEFSFLIAESALELHILDERTYNVLLGAAVLSIVASPFALRLGEGLAHRIEARISRSALAAIEAEGAAVEVAAEAATGRAADGEAGRPTIVVLGAGRVGRLIIRAVRPRGFRSSPSTTIRVASTMPNGSVRRRCSGTPPTRRSCGAPSWTARGCSSSPSATI